MAVESHRFGDCGKGKKVDTGQWLAGIEPVIAAANQ
jgi:hypothetical protein